MIVCLAQTKPTKGNIGKNMAQHLELVNLAAKEKADLVIFPELSVTGYEPHLARSLAIFPEDPVLDVFQKEGNRHQLTVGVGMPVRCNQSICIGMILFSPDEERMLYTKKYLHEDELPFFESGNVSPGLVGNADHRIALAICYEISVAPHAVSAYTAGANIYLSSVAKTSDGVRKAHQRLQAIAKEYGMITLMCNSVGFQDNFTAAGQTAIWNKDGKLLGQLSETETGLLLWNSTDNNVKSIIA